MQISSLTARSHHEVNTRGCSSVSPVSGTLTVHSLQVEPSLRGRVSLIDQPLDTLKLILTFIPDEDLKTFIALSPYFRDKLSKAYFIELAKRYVSRLAPSEISRSMKHYCNLVGGVLTKAGYISDRATVTKLYTYVLGSMNIIILGVYIGENARVEDEAWVTDKAQVTGNSKVCRRARIMDRAWIGRDSMVTDNARVWNNAKVMGSSVRGYAKIYDLAEIYESGISGKSEVYEYAKVYNGRVYWDAIVSGKAVVCGAHIQCSAQVRGDAYVYRFNEGDTTINGITIESGWYHGYNSRDWDCTIM